MRAVRFVFGLFFLIAANAPASTKDTPVSRRCLLLAGLTTGAGILSYQVFLGREWDLRYGDPKVVKTKLPTGRRLQLHPNGDLFAMTEAGESTYGSSGLNVIRRADLERGNFEWQEIMQFSPRPEYGFRMLPSGHLLAVEGVKGSTLIHSDANGKNFQRTLISNEISHVPHLGPFPLTGSEFALIAKTYEDDAAVHVYDAANPVDIDRPVRKLTLPMGARYGFVPQFSTDGKIGLSGLGCENPRQISVMNTKDGKISRYPFDKALAKATPIGRPGTSFLWTPGDGLYLKDAFGRVAMERPHNTRLYSESQLGTYLPWARAQGTELANGLIAHVHEGNLVWLDSDGIEMGRVYLQKPQRNFEWSRPVLVPGPEETLAVRVADTLYFVAYPGVLRGKVDLPRNPFRMGRLNTINVASRRDENPLESVVAVAEDTVAVFTWTGTTESDHTRYTSVIFATLNRKK